MWCTDSSIMCKSQEVIVSVYSRLIRAQLEYCVQFEAPYFNKDEDKLEKFHRTAIKMIRGHENITYKKSWEEGS